MVSASHGLDWPDATAFANAGGAARITLIEITAAWPANLYPRAGARIAEAEGARRFVDGTRIGL
ncbi:hypothetical protein ACFLT5_00470 [Chloroflexota bacterium]